MRLAGLARLALSAGSVLSRKMAVTLAHGAASSSLKSSALLVIIVPLKAMPLSRGRAAGSHRHGQLQLSGSDQKRQSDSFFTVPRLGCVRFRCAADGDVLAQNESKLTLKPQALA